MSQAALIFLVVILSFLCCCVISCCCQVQLQGDEGGSESRDTMTERRRQRQQQPTSATTTQQAPPQPFPPTDHTEEQIKKQLFFRSIEDGEGPGKILMAADNDGNDGNPEGHIPIQSYRAEMVTGKPECCICLNGYDAADVVCWAKTNQCDHLFHDKCIIEWLKDHDDCPLCRAKLMIVED